MRSPKRQCISAEVKQNEHPEQRKGALKAWGYGRAVYGSACIKQTLEFFMPAAEMCRWTKPLSR